MKLIVGLGNPGKEYDKTRHSVGFMLIDKYLGNVRFKDKFNGIFYENNNDEKIIFLKPQTYMNNSGECIKKFVNYYNIKLEDVLVIQDDLDMNIGSFKFKTNSSSGGHNGIKSIISNLGTNKFLRLKIGIKNDNIYNTIDFVLSKFSNKEIELINLEALKSCIEDFIKYDSSYVMNKYNGK